MNSLNNIGQENTTKHNTIFHTKESRKKEISAISNKKSNEKRDKFDVYPEKNKSVNFSNDSKKFSHSEKNSPEQIPQIKINNGNNIIQNAEINSKLISNDIKNKSKQSKYRIIEIARMTYKIDKNLFRDNKYFVIFGYNFVKKIKNQFKIIISGKEYGIKYEINISEFEDYGIKKENKTLEVILKGENINDLSCMFDGCKSLIKIVFSTLINQNITNISYMFWGCENLIKIYLPLFNTQNVKNMSSMFCDCKKLTKVDLSTFNTQNVTDMSWLFFGCKNLVKVDLSSFHTQNVKDMRNLFRDCKSLAKIDLSSFYTQNVNGTSYILYGCESLNKIKVSRKNFNKIKRDLKIQNSKLIILEV